mmetsp:Transcript_19258/g.68018  ORF Transcript_19258/g.68018 Transcript_19258/m.68018 type:complete len:254 (-) Transcript_19258:228-989(-)
MAWRWRRCCRRWCRRSASCPSRRTSAPTTPRDRHAPPASLRSAPRSPRCAACRSCCTRRPWWSGCARPRTAWSRRLPSWASRPLPRSSPSSRLRRGAERLARAATATAQAVSAASAAALRMAAWRWWAAWRCVAACRALAAAAVAATRRALPSTRAARLRGCASCRRCSCAAPRLLGATCPFLGGFHGRAARMRPTRAARAWASAGTALRGRRLLRRASATARWEMRGWNACSSGWQSACSRHTRWWRALRWS